MTGLRAGVASSGHGSGRIDAGEDVRAETLLRLIAVAHQ